MRLSKRFKVGGFTCHALDAGSQQLDGGAMFGVVPKPLWEKRIAADEKNRIPLAMRCLLIEHSDGLVLIDTGVGNKESDKFRSIYGIENSGERGPTRLEDAIGDAGFSPRDVRFVINTHLHFDHAGGNTVAVGSEVVPSFPDARYIVQRGELDFAYRANERTSASYLEPNFGPVRDAGLWSLVDGEAEVLPGITVIATPGHVPHHQSVVIRDGTQTACFLGDVVPTSAHVPLPWIMGYDLEPLVTLETKRELLARAAGEDWLLIFEHDPGSGIGRVRHEGGTYHVDSIDFEAE